VRAIYRLLVTPGPSIAVPTGAMSVTLGHCDVLWEVDSSGHLAAVQMTIHGQPIRLTDGGAINPSYRELEDLAFRTATYIANSLLIQTGIDALDPEQVVRTSPRVFPETPEEEAIFDTTRQAVHCSQMFTYSVTAPFDPSNYAAGHKHTTAVMAYADGLRVSNPFLRYAQFYQVIEYYFPKKQGKELDRAVSKHLSTYDSKFDEMFVERVRDIRNRCTHPGRADYLNPESTASFQEVQKHLPRILEVVRLLVQHPPS
jgi:hypothetical protein